MNNSNGAGYGTKSESRNRLLALLIALAAVLICICLASSAMPTVDAIDSTVDATESTPTEQPDIITIEGDSSSGVAEANYKTLDDALANLPEITAGTYTFTIKGDLTIDQDINLTDRGKIVINNGVTVTVGEVTITGKPLSVNGLINSRGTLVLNGTDITTESNHAIRINGGFLTVNGGSITSNGGIDGTTSGSAVYIRDGTVTINDGTFYSARSYTINVYSSSSTLTIKDGTFSNDTSASHVIYGYYGNITIENGTFSTSGSGADVYVNSNSRGTSLANVTIGTVESNVVLNSIRGNGGHLTLVNATVTDVLGHFKTDSDFSGGRFLSDVSDMLPVGKVCVEENGVWTVKDIEDGDAIVSLTRGETTYYYASLASAARDFTAGDTLTLLKDCTSDTYVNINGGWTGTLDLNGHTYRYTGDSSYAIRIGSPINDTGYDEAGFSIVGPGSILVDSADTVALYLWPNASNRNYPLNISIDSDVTLSNLRLSGTANVAFTKYLAEKVVQGGFVVPTADGGHRIYGNPTVALVESADGSAYLLSDYSGALTLSTAGTYSLDLRGNTLKYSTTTITVSGDGVSFTVSNGSIASTSTTATTPVAFINNNNATLTFNDVNLSAAGYWGINVNGSHTNIDLTINGGSLTSEGLAIYYPVTGTLTLRDTYITAPSGVQFCGAGSLIIDGSTITATAEALNGPTKDPSESDGSFDDGAAVSIITRGGGYQQSGETISVSITDSKLISLNNVAYQDYRAQRTTVDGTTSWVTGSSTSLTSAVDSVEIGEGTEITGASGKAALTTDTDYSKGKYAISDVVLSSAVSDNLMATGYSQQTLSDGTAVVSQATANNSDYSVIVNGQTVYLNDLKQAYTLVDNKRTITVLRNANISGIVFDEDKSVTLDLGPYKLTVSDGSTGLTIDAGSVTITAATVEGVTGGITSTTANILVVNNATLIIEGGEYTANKTIDGFALRTNEGSDTTINGGTFYSTRWVVNNLGEMEINAGKFTSIACSNAECDGDFAYTIINNGNMVINGEDAQGNITVTVIGSQGALASSSGTIEVNGGHYQTQPCPKNHKGNVFYALYVAGEVGITSAVVNDGTFIAYNRSTAYVGNSHDGGRQLAATLVINGGSFSVSNPTSTSCSVYKDANTAAVPSVSINAGTYSIAPDVSIVAPGLKVIEDGSRAYTIAAITPDEAVCSVEYEGEEGTVVYYETSLARAFSLAPNGAVITLLKNVSESVTLPEGHDVTLDLAGFELTNVSGHTILVSKNAELTIMDSSTQKTGVVDNVTHGKAALYVDANATVVLNGGAFTRSEEAGTSPSVSGGNSWYTINNFGTLTINAGVTVSQNEGQFSSLIRNGEGPEGTLAYLYIYGGTFEDGVNNIKNSGTLVIKDGTFSNAATSSILNWETATINGGTYNSNGMVLRNGSYEGSLGSLTVTGGLFTSADGFDAVGIHTASEEGWTISITGGTFSTDVNAYCADGYISVLNSETGSFEVIEGYTATFVDSDGKVLKTVQVPDGTKLTYKDAPDTIFQDRHIMMWFDPEGDTWTEGKLDGDITIKRTMMPLVADNIEADAELVKGATVTLSLKEGVEGTIGGWFVSDVTSNLDLYQNVNVSIYNDDPANTITEDGYYIAAVVSGSGESLSVTLMTFQATFEDYYHINLVVDEKSVGTYEVAYGKTIPQDVFDQYPPAGLEIFSMTYDGQDITENPPIYASGTIEIDMVIEEVEVHITADISDPVDGQTVTLTSDLVQHESLTYTVQWYDGTVPISGATGNSIEVSVNGQYVFYVSMTYGEQVYSCSEPITVCFAEDPSFGFTYSEVDVYEDFSAYALPFIGLDGVTTTFSSSDSRIEVTSSGVVSVNGAIGSDFTAVITATASTPNNDYSATYTMNVKAEVSGIVTPEGENAATVSELSDSDKNDVFTVMDPLIGTSLPETTVDQWRIVDIVVPDDEGNPVTGRTSFTVPLSYFGVDSATGYQFYVVHITDSGPEVISGVDLRVTSDGVTVYVDGFSPFAFYATELPDTGSGENISVYALIAAAVVLVECLALYVAFRRY